MWFRHWQWRGLMKSHPKKGHVELLRFATLELWEATNAAHSDFGLPVLGAEGHFKLTLGPDRADLLALV